MPLTRFDVSIRANGTQWIVIVKGKVDSHTNDYQKAESRWAELTRDLPMLRG
jgi:hypothetical protein